ncbi:hypothetical protein [Nonomuraea typhae]|uniref:Uncharacterized protein n=1 Tax=Nonomuraea typhae TaxID=2603600 RepID=A0ABW7YUQ5_9ACTN
MTGRHPMNFHTYGTATLTMPDLTHALSVRLGVTFIERDSHYRGTYLTATLANGTRIDIQPNAIPGDEPDDDLYAPGQPEATLLILTTEPDHDNELHRHLAAIEGLNHLDENTAQTHRSTLARVPALGFFE